MNEDVEVIEEYDILSYYQTLQYYVINGSISITEEELDGYALPQEYTGPDIWNELIERIEMLTQLEEPLQLINQTKTELITYMENQLLILENNFVERTE